MEVRHGTLGNVYGRPVRTDAFTFMPADVQLDGTSFGFHEPLAEHAARPLPPSLRVPLAGGFDAAWVRARIPVRFGVTPELSEMEKTLLCQGFAAVTSDHVTCYPFACADVYGRTALMFSDEGPDEALKRSIAAAFWGLLLRDPDDLDDFEERVYHPGAGIWLNYGCDAGRVYCDESQE